MEHGADLRSEGPQLHRRYKVIRRVLLLGVVHARHPRHDGGALGLPPHPAFALVSAVDTDHFFFNSWALVIHIVPVLSNGE